MNLVRALDMDIVSVYGGSPALQALLEGYAEHYHAGPIGTSVEWRAWDGSPTGYEGMLAECFHPLILLLDQKKTNG